MEHQRRDAYWRHGSVCEEFSAIACPVFAVGGWADAYTNAVPRLLAGLRVPRLGVIGPWGHLYPHDGAPGPAIGFLQEATRWWDQWLKGRDTGIMREPMLRAYVEEWSAPGDRDLAPGRWVAETAWPSERIETVNWPFGVSGLGGEAEGEATIRSPCHVGAACGEWMGTGVAGQAPEDQRADDALSQVFDSAPLSERLELLGAPEIEIMVASDTPSAQLAARLCDVAPDGSSRRISYGVLNLTHRDSHADPTPLTPGAFVRVRLTLNDCGYAFEKGHVVRLALSTAYWPMIWPAPEAATLTLRLPGALRLPARPVSAPDGVVRFAPPAHGPRAPTTLVAQGSLMRGASFDAASGVATYVTDSHGGLFGEGVTRFDDIDASVSHDLRRELTISADDPPSARYVLTQRYAMGREGWRIRIETRCEMEASADEFRVRSTLRALEDGKEVAKRDWDARVARDCL